MEVEINIWVLCGIIVLAVVVGYFIGRRERISAEREEESLAENAEAASEDGRKRGHRMGQGKVIVSPVDGKVHFFREGSRNGAVIEPEQGRIYAPMSGKIVKLYPMGNAFLLQGNDGCGILIRVGRQSPDELCSMYFRARIVQNEIVNKGKLLLEFDREKLKAAGEDINVTVGVEGNLAEEEIWVTEKESVKVGEELLRICSCQDT